MPKLGYFNSKTCIVVFSLSLFANQAQNDFFTMLGKILKCKKKINKLQVRASYSILQVVRHG